MAGACLPVDFAAAPSTACVAAVRLFRTALGVLFPPLLRARVIEGLPAASAFTTGLIIKEPRATACRSEGKPLRRLASWMQSIKLSGGMEDLEQGAPETLGVCIEVRCQCRQNAAHSLGQRKRGGRGDVHGAPSHMLTSTAPADLP